MHAFVKPVLVDRKLQVTTAGSMKRSVATIATGAKASKKQQAQQPAQRQQQQQQQQQQSKKQQPQQSDSQGLATAVTCGQQVQQAGSAPAASPHPQWRLELFFKSADELNSQIPFLRSHGLLRLNITNKSVEDDLVGTVRDLISGLSAGTTQQQQQQQQQQHNQNGLTTALRHSTPAGAGTAAAVAPAGLDICVHYSFKYQYDKTPERSLQRLLKFCSELQQLQQQQQQVQDTLPMQQASGTTGGSSSSSSSGSDGASQPLPVHIHVLLVSGGGKKKRFETVSALQALKQQQKRQQQQQQQQTVSSSSNGRVLQLPYLAVTCNPYLPSEEDLAEERRRLKAKLQTGLVDRVYLQMGTDLQRLQSGLDHIADLVQQLSAQQPGFKPPQLLGSVFLPSKRLLAQMKFRPWNGVFLSGEYLSSVEAAERVTAQLLKVYAAAGVVPLLESAVKTEQELQKASELLSVGNSAAAVTDQ